MADPCRKFYRVLPGLMDGPVPAFLQVLGIQPQSAGGYDWADERRPARGGAGGAAK